MPLPVPAYELSVKGRALLRVIVIEIRSGRIIAGDSLSFIPYSEALAALGQPKPKLFSGRRLQSHGLTDLNEWTKASIGIPNVCGLIVNKSSHRPSDGHPESHGLPSIANWKRWWMDQTATAIVFDWTPFL